MLSATQSKPSYSAPAGVSSHFSLARSKYRAPRSESGAIVVLVTAVLFISLMIGGIVIDNGRHEIAVQSIRRAVDAAALAGASRIDGSVDGWRRAKQFAAMTLRQNAVENVGKISLQNLRLNGGTVNDYWDTNDTTPSSAQTAVRADFLGTEGTVGDIWVSVERGAFWFDSDANGLNARHRFESWEGASNGKPHNTDGYLVSNAIRVRMRLSNWRTTLGGLFGIGTFGDIEEVAIAAADGNIMEPLFPIGTQIGFLRHNNSPFNGNGNNLHAHMDPYTASADRYLATFAGARGSERQTTNNQVPVSGLPATSLPITEERFEEGYQRYENGIVSNVYEDVNANVPTICLPQPFPVNTRIQNCKAIEIRSTILGAPSDRPGQSINAAGLLNAFQNPVAVNVGTWFAPLADASTLTTDSSYMNTIVDMMNRGSNPQFRDFFRRFRDSGSERMRRLWPRLQSVIGANDPFGRLPDDPNYELLKRIPTTSLDVGGQTIVEEFTRQDMSGGGDNLWRFHHPLCFNERINGGRANDENMRVLHGYAAIVDSDMPNVKYTDFRYDGQPQNAIEVVPNSHPRIVGRNKIIIWGGNFTNLDARFPPQAPPAPHIPQSFMRSRPYYTDVNGGTVYDNTFSYFNTAEAAGYNEWKRKKNEFKDDLDNLSGCYADTGDENCDEIPESDDLAYDPGVIRKCFNIEALLQPVQDAIAAGFGLDFNQDEECDADDPNDCWNVYSVNTDGHEHADHVEDAILNFLDNLTQVPLQAYEGTHCSHFLLNRSDPNSGESYEPNLEPFYAGLGCAGLEYSVEYSDDPINFATGKSQKEQSPTLVREFDAA